MVEIGYALSSEEHKPDDLVRNARRAEEVGFTFALISDHFHPWVDQQGNSPFVWSVIGGIAQVTQNLRLGTGVTCPTFRTHPAIIAHAAATCADMMPGRFFLGLGTGENLNEHILGQRWPAHEIRLEMLEEAIEIIRLLWEGGEKSHYGKYYTLENARLYTLPEEPTPIYIAASGEKTAEFAGRVGDGFISTAPKKELTENFDKANSKGSSKMGQIGVCWAADEATAVKTAYKWWPNAGLGGELSQELPLPTHFEQAVKMVREEDIAQGMICGPDPRKHIEAIYEYMEAGFDHIYIHQIGPDQEGFFRFYEREVLPEFKKQT